MEKAFALPARFQIQIHTSDSYPIAINKETYVVGGEFLILDWLDKPFKLPIQELSSIFLSNKREKNLML